MQGEVVVCKDFIGHPIVARLWATLGSALFIHSEEEFSKRVNGKCYLDPVGFPASDCYRYDDVAKLELANSTIPQWDRLTPWEKE